MRQLLAMALSLALVGFLGCDDGGSDGDADADADVGCDTDCGEVGQACNMSTDCPALQVCHEHRCDCAFNRSYEVEITSGAIYARATGGHCWDGEEPHCEDPDVFAVMEVGDVTYTTEPVRDSLNPIWSESFTVFVDCHTFYGVNMYDDDPEEAQDDLVFSFPGGMWWFTEENLRSAGMHICTEDPGTRTCFDFVISPM